LQHIILEVGERFYAPHGWQARTIDVSVGKIVAHCMEPHDVVLSKLGAGREKDLEFASAAAALGLVEQSVLLTRLRLVPATADHLGLIAERIATLFKGVVLRMSVAITRTHDRIMDACPVRIGRQSATFSRSSGQDRCL
jgi:hypothetical protein